MKLKLKKSFLIGFLMSCHILFAQNTVKTMLKLPDTGQNQSFTDVFGEDNDYNNSNSPKFKTENGIVTDLVTSLQWQQTDGGELTFEQAIDYCENLTLSGFTDWRLPTSKEAFSILNHQNSRPALDLNYFSTTQAQYWWTSDKQWNDNQKIWVVNSGGGIGNHPKNETISAGGNKRFHVRAVRNTTKMQELAQRWKLNTDGTLRDQTTGLIWQKTVSNQTFTWEEALEKAEKAIENSQTDWKLPNIKELQSLTDVTISNPCISIQFFEGLSSQKFWSSTSLPNHPEKAWFLDSRFGITSHDDKQNKNYIILVRGKIE